MQLLSFGPIPLLNHSALTQVIDIPLALRSVAAFTSTLGHKVNHRFTGTNTDFSLAHHPVFGGVVVLLASTTILPGQVFLRQDTNLKLDFLASMNRRYTQELFVSYGYHNGEDSYEDFVKNEENYSEWYIQEFKKLTEKEAKSIWDY